LIAQLRSRDDRDDAGMLARRGRVDAFDFGMSMRASKNGDVKHLGKPDIVSVLTESANQSRIFAPLDPGADKFTDRHLISPVSDSGSHASVFTQDSKLWTRN